MKKFVWMLAIFGLLTLSGCVIVKNQNNEMNTTWTNISTGINTEIINYTGTLTVAGIWPDISFESTVESDILVLKKNYEDHTDHLFFSRMFWDNYLDIFEDCIPGNIVKFDGKVKVLDAAAGNRYYEVVETNTLEKVWIPSKEEVINLLDKYNYCEDVVDCATLYGKCPLPCHIAVNSKFTGTVESIVDNFWNNQESQCMYKCMEIQSVKCENYKCIVN